MSNINWDMWLGFDETKDFLKILEDEKQDALMHLSGNKDIEAYAKADGIYLGICRTLDIVEGLKVKKEGEE